MYKLGIIGVGSMGGAILDGILDEKIVKPSDIQIYNPIVEGLDKYIKKGVKLADSNKSLADSSEVVLLAVVPQILTDVKEEIGTIEDKLIVSIAAGVSISRLKEIFGSNRYIRVMPNTPLLVKEGMTAVAYEEDVSEEDLDFVLSIFNSMGRTTLLDEKLIDPFMAVAGCMPAYVYKFIEAAADGAVSQGLPREDAYEYIAQSVVGAAQMVLKTSKHPGVLKDQVTSPGGSTIKGVLALEENGFSNSVIKAVLASSKLDI